MFRAVLFAVGVVLVAAGSFATVAGCPLYPVIVFGGLLICGLLFERYVYKPIREEPPGAGWERTAERFADPTSGQGVVVYFNSRTGERRYVAEGDNQDPETSHNPNRPKP